jgi:hypothetical protein
VTKTGKPRFSFVRDPEGRRIVEEIPDGYEISESVNGVVSLVRERIQKLLPVEVAAVEEAVRRHPRARNYRVNVRHDRIEVYEKIGLDLDGLLSSLKGLGIRTEGRQASLQRILDDRAQFTPVLQFILEDEETRVYRAERWCYSGSIDGWLFVDTGPMEQMARRMIPALGTDAFFELP